MTLVDVAVTPTQKSLTQRTTLTAAFVALAAFVILQGFYAVKLNEIFYSQNGPFYDSLSYYQKLAICMSTARTEGIWKGLDEASRQTTVCLPFLEGALVGRWLEPSRALGVWLQTIWVGALAASLLWYFVKCRHANPWLAFAFTLPLLSIDTLYSYNGGLSDFRMDLHLYLLTALAGVWYLVTYHTTRIWPWLLCGAAIALSCLSRATTPMYIALMLGPPILWRLVFGSNQTRVRLVLSVAAMTFTTALLSGWFYIKSWTFIHFYYFEWNAAANAHIPFSQALRHFHQAWLNVGAWVVLLCIVLMALSLSGKALLEKRQGAWARLILLVDWKLLYIGLAPVLMLVAMRARLDAFLPSMPAAFGFLMFCLLPFRVDMPVKGQMNVAMTLVLSLAACTALAVRGIDNNLRPPNFLNRMEVYEKCLHTLETDAAHLGKHDVRYVAPYLGIFITDGLTNIMIYDHGYHYSGGKVSKGRMQVRLDVPVGFYCTAMPADWEKVPGATDDEKIAYLTDNAKEKIDYVFLPDEDSTTWLETTVRFNYANVFIRRIKDRLLAQNCWTPISEPLSVSDSEHFVIYRNSSKPSGGMDPISFVTREGDVTDVLPKGIDADGWMDQNARFTVPEGAKIKRVRLHMELPEWSGLESNGLTATVNGRKLLDVSLDKGKPEMLIPIDEREGAGVIELHAAKTFPIPAPDTRRRAFRILKMEFETK